MEKQIEIKDPKNDTLPIMVQQECISHIMSNRICVQKLTNILVQRDHIQ